MVQRRAEHACEQPVGESAGPENERVAEDEGVPGAWAGSGVCAVHTSSFGLAARNDKWHN